MNIWLFGPIWRGTWHNDYTYNGNVTWQGSIVLSGGGGVGGYLAGRAIFLNEGWAEWTKAWPAITNKATLRQQYECHVTAGQIGVLFTGTYNLERAQSNRSNWFDGVAFHHCNWDK